jgi:hypothetical protein
MDWAFFSVFLFSILPQAVALSLELSAIVLVRFAQAAKPAKKSKSRTLFLLPEAAP